jgi:hypothetical protein
MDKRRTAKLLFTLAIIAIGLGATMSQARAYDCTGTPADAVMTLPQPLAKWGALVCTQYGHIISNREGWIWSNPGTYSPVFIPSQIVQTNPAPFGNQSYFTKIEMNKVVGDEFQAAYSSYHKGFGQDPAQPDGYRLDLVSISGKALKLYFFDYGSYAWAIWCTQECDPNSRFMILDMSKRPT